ncbi:MAG: MBOAT family protein [Lachnospiraceae bacterium]|nr:MBOAT family protein [Lachnospiraceae bacterium]
MVFSSIVFLFAFLPLTLLGYYLLPRFLRNIFLFLVSIAFYAYGEPKFVLVLLLSIVVNYLFGLLVDRFRERKPLVRGLLALMLVFNFSFLVVYKYLNFITANLRTLLGDTVTVTEIVLPIGISFFTFQAVSYVLDIYRQHGEVQKNPLHVGLYIAFFPQLIAGPIVRYETVAREIKKRYFSFSEISLGVKRFLMGLGKKVLLANAMAVVADYAFNLVDYAAMPIGTAWLGALAYTFQIYFDFSGYSDMAIGLGLMFGFHFLENFNYPYISRSVSEFWRRWHISLGTWFRDYVYIPLGGSRVKLPRLVLNLFLVWGLTGIWHGASWTFLLWGLFYFALLTFEKLTGFPEKQKGGLFQVLKILYVPLTLLAVLLGWCLFRAPSLVHASQYIQTLFGLNSQVLFDTNTLYYFGEYRLFFLACLLLSTPLVKIVVDFCKKYPVLRQAYQLCVPLWYLGVFYACISELVLGTHNPFIYFNF